MKKTALAFIVTIASGSVVAESISDGVVELSLNVIRSDGISIGPSTAQLQSSANSVTLTSSPIRLAYRLNDQLSIIAGAGLFSYTEENGTTNNEFKGNVVTGGAYFTMESDIFIEALWSRISVTSDTGGTSSDYDGNQYELFAGRRFNALGGLFIEPKAGVTFGSVELDDADTERTFGDGLGTELGISLGYVL